MIPYEMIEVLHFLVNWLYEHGGLRLSNGLNKFETDAISDLLNIVLFGIFMVLL